MSENTIVLGEQAAALDKRISERIQEADRGRIWKSASNILDSYEKGNGTVLALGYVQSGKTTSITALCAAAADRGFQVIIAILGSTLLLRDQNRTRVEDYLGLEENNYRWVSITELNQKRTGKEIENWLGRERVILIPVLKNPSVINKVSNILNEVNLQNSRCLVIDDEADQASLNTNVNTSGESSTYSAIMNLRSKLPSHLYVQYTATPYAPLLLEPSDPLMPKDVEFLIPGHGYTGGREFFVDHATKVLRVIPSGDEQNARAPITELPKSLEVALANYLVGAAHLYFVDKDSAPISMLIHSTFKNDLQEKYHFLIERFIRKYKESDDLQVGEFSKLITDERSRLYELGIDQISNEQFWASLAFVLKEITLWLVNSASEVKKVQWNLAPFHILIGGNKLDRGFTVEGLTVTYMNRPASDQIDTIEQRARAFGYRTSLLPYCQFFATARTIKTLRGIVHTEDDLRANLRDVLESGETVSDWAKKIGLFLPAQTRPTRDVVLPALSHFNLDGDWYTLRKPFVGTQEKHENLEILRKIGLLDASFVQYQRMQHRTLEIPLEILIKEILLPWRVNLSSPGWKHEEILEFLKRRPDLTGPSYVLLLGNPEDSNKPRLRKWVEDTGFVNLFQGKDLTHDKPGYDYIGDRRAGLEQYGEDKVVLQVHHVSRRNHDDKDLYTLTIHIGDGRLVRRANG
jgi:hypothetical protein